MNAVSQTTARSGLVGTQKGFIAYCETNLRYEKGLKAWIFLGPYLLGAFLLERIINSTGACPAPWLGFLAYLILFPELWRRVLKWTTAKNCSKARGPLLATAADVSK